MKYEIKGAWICPDGIIHYTDNIQSHSKVIEELGIRQNLEEISKNNIQFDIPEDYKYDLAYIAMKIGYIRFTTFKNQIGIETGIEFKDISEKQSKSIEEVIFKFNLYKPNMFIVFEKFQENEFIKFNNIDSFLKSVR